ncbi:DUF948 domain-containing protein [Paenibacillus gansuensis]|uniref:DUF948 domain-containing protein n=1 Tax=Paenibacillus gansuensis TaxID=306542 RepID=A0ABW5PFL2_9BACL
MTTWLWVCSAAIFIIVMLYTLRVLFVFQRTLIRLDSEMKSAMRQLEAVSGQAQQVLKEAKHVTSDTNRKLKALDGFFHSVEHTGQLLEQTALAARQFSHELAGFFTGRSGARPTSRAAEWSDIVRSAAMVWLNRSDGGSPPDKHTAASEEEGPVTKGEKTHV